MLPIQSPRQVGMMFCRRVVGECPVLKMCGQTRTVGQVGQCGQNRDSVHNCPHSFRTGQTVIQGMMDRNDATHHTWRESQGCAVDVEQTGGEPLHIVGGHGHGHRACIVKLLAHYLYAGILYQTHHIVHRQVGKGKRQLCHFAPLYYAPGLYCLSGRLAIGRDKP